MHRGRILGELWGARRARGLDGRKLVLVADGDADRVVVAIDTLDGRVGQEALVAFGSGARNVIAPGPDNRGVLADAAVALLVDGPLPEGEG
jgi:microcompartment protein CcmK/EutM